MRQRLPYGIIIFIIFLGILTFSLGVDSFYTREPQEISNTQEGVPAPSFPVHSNIIATLFWVGETADASNDYISNVPSYWDEEWELHYGGVDSPDNRCGYHPCAFTPKENPFYVALPYGEYDKRGKLKENARTISWFNDISSEEELLKNRWIKVSTEEKTCYAQWQDVGPFETDDFDYVFGNSRPKNTFGEKAGIDLSPAVWTCLGLTTNAPVSWQFVEESAVPDGVWKEIITTSRTTY